jgi:hypothetical protein
VLVTKISSHVHFLTFARIECIFRLTFIVKDKTRVCNSHKSKERGSLSLQKKGAHESKCVQSKESVHSLELCARFDKSKLLVWRDLVQSFHTP